MCEIRRLKTGQRFCGDRFPGKALQTNHFPVFAATFGRFFSRIALESLFKGEFGFGGIVMHGEIFPTRGPIFGFAFGCEARGFTHVLAGNLKPAICPTGVYGLSPWDDS